jgi:hypothetical protein
MDLQPEYRCRIELLESGTTDSRGCAADLLRARTGEMLATSESLQQGLDQIIALVGCQRIGAVLFLIA